MGLVTSTCTECTNGYLLDQGYGFTEIPAGAVPVQRCDTCEFFEGDLDAAKAAAVDLRTAWGAHLDSDGNIVTGGPPADEDEAAPGDAWVFLPC